jgi:hypothetical protein
VTFWSPAQCWKQCHQQEAKTHTYKLEGGERSNCNRELEKLVGFCMAFVICTILSRAPDLSHSTICFKCHFKLLVWVCWWGLKACRPSFSARLQCLYNFVILLLHLLRCRECVMETRCFGL